MQTYQDLNNYGNTPVNYGSWQDYTIVFGNNAGNLSATEYENGSFPLYKQTPLTTFSDVSRDLLINLTFSNVASLDDVTYFGENPNISVVSSAANAYTVLGVRSVSDYDEAFGNVFVTTVNGSLTGFLLTTLVDDQFGNTRTWTANVSLVANPGFSVTSPLTYNEDTYANITGVTVNDTGGNATQTYNMTVSVPSAAGDISYAGGAFANSVTITNTQSNITSSFSGNTWRFRPAADYTANTQATFNLVRTFDNRLWTRTANLNIGNTHSEYSVPTSISFTEDAFANIANISITDTRPDNIDPAIQYQISLVSSNVATGVIRYANVDYANLTLTNTKANLNTIFSSNAIKWKPAADYLANTQITYSQTQVTDGVVQANAVVIPVIATGNLHNEYSIPASFNLTEDEIKSMAGMSITDLRPDNIDANIQYSITLASQDASNVKIRYNSIDSGNQTITGTKSAINAIFGNAMVRPSIVPASDWFGNAVITYTQVQTTDGITQANAIPISVFVTEGSDYSLDTSYIVPTTANNFSKNTFNIVDADTFANSYTITVQQTSGPAGLFWLNGSNLNSNSTSVTNTKSNLNSANLAFLPNTSNTAVNSSYNWSLTKNYPNGSSVNLASNVSCAVDLVMTNVTNNRNYTSNTFTQIFSNVSTRPSFDSDFGSNSSTYTISVSCSNNFFSTSNVSTASSNLTFTGTKTAIDSWLSDVRFYPGRGVTGNLTATMLVTEAATTWVNKTFTLVGAAGNIDPALLITETYSTPGNVTYVPDIRRALYAQYDMVLIAGGGAGAWGGGGGGAGNVLEVTNQVLSNTWPQSYTFTVGAGGTTKIDVISYGRNSGNGNPGLSTTALGYTASSSVDSTRGGAGGEGTLAPGHTFFDSTAGEGGARNASGNTTVAFPGYADLRNCPIGTAQRFRGGGGQGSSGNVGGYTTFLGIDNPLAPTFVFVGFDGGNGTASTVIPGQTYAAGGGGGSGGFNCTTGVPTTAATLAGNKGTATATFGNGGNGGGWTTQQLVPENGQPGAVIIKWKSL